MGSSILLPSLIFLIPLRLILGPEGYVKFFDTLDVIITPLIDFIAPHLVALVDKLLVEYGWIPPA